jgi:patatin-like phospholipase/acyl hydrolase
LKIFPSLFKKQQPKKKKLLCFDGGGVRAIAGIVFLNKLEAYSGKKVFDIFDVFVGTSAGAFNAACFASNEMLASEVKKYWSKEYINKIMKTSYFWDPASLIQARPRYDSKGKLEVLDEIFKDTILGASKKPIISLCYDIEKRHHVIHNSFSTPNITIKDALAASSAAPMYFPTHKTQNNQWMIDGSIVTNNPSLIGYSLASKHYKGEEISILSIGTGINSLSIDGKTSSKWGGVGWLRNDIMGMMLDSEIDNDVANNILGDSYLRINSSYGKINKFLDDDSEENIERIHLMGMEWWDMFGKKTIEFIEH